MKNTAKAFIKRRVINMIVIITITLLFVITYLGFHQWDIEPVEIVTQVEINPQN